MLSLGDKLCQIRKARGLTQENIAEMLGVTRQAVAKWESGSVYPSSNNIIKLSKALQIPVEEIAEDCAVPKKQRGPKATFDIYEYLSKKDNEEKELRSRIELIKSRIIFAFLMLSLCVIFLLICWFLSEKLGYKIYAYRYIKKYHVTFFTAFVIFFAAVFGKKRTAVIILAGFCIGTILGQITGAISFGRSPIQFNEGWLGLAIVWDLGLLLSLSLDYVSYHKKFGSVFKKGRLSITKFLCAAVCVLLFISLTGFLSAKRLSFNFGAESGYRIGFETGREAALNQRPYQTAFVDSSAKVPCNIKYGTSAYSGFALYWSSGYDDGFEEGGDIT